LTTIQYKIIVIKEHSLKCPFNLIVFTNVAYLSHFTNSAQVKFKDFFMMYCAEYTKTLVTYHISKRAFSIQFSNLSTIPQEFTTIIIIKLYYKVYYYTYIFHISYENISIYLKYTYSLRSLK